MYCPFNCRAQQLYADLASEGKSLHAINTQLQELDLPSLLTHCRLCPSPPLPALMKPNQPPATVVHPGVQFSTIVTRSRFGPLKALEDDAPLPQDYVISPAPSSTPPPLVRRPRRLPGYLAPPSTLTPSDPDPGISYSTIEAEVHQLHSLPSYRGQGPGRALQHAIPLLPSSAMPLRPSTPPQAPIRPAAGPASPASSMDTVISLFTLLWKSYHLHQKGTSVPEILTYLWPTLSMLISSI